MKQALRRFPLIVSSVMAAIIVNSSSAAASPITLSGGFTGYDGIVQCSGTLMNGVSIQPPLCTGFPVVSFDFALTETLNFLVEGSSDPNLLSFTPGPVQDVTIGQDFLIGTFTYQNGTWAFPFGADSITVSFDFSVVASSSDPTLDGAAWSDRMILFITNNLTTRPPAANADFFYFQNYPSLGSFRVFEQFDSPGSNIGSVDVYGVIGSIIPTRFANAQGDGFIDPGITAQPVPEPGTVVLVASGLVAFFRRRRRKAR